MKTQSKSVVASVVAALFAVAAFNIHADEVKSGGSPDRPARALDADDVKSQGASSKPGRALDDGGAVKAPNKKKHGRAVEGERAAMPRTGQPGNDLDESTVKSQGPSDKASRAANKESK
jgi:hypothetical protein